MKMFKKLSALLIAAVMVLAMAVPAMAAETANLKISGLEAGDTVSLYRIAEPTEDYLNGKAKGDASDWTFIDGVSFATFNEPTSEEINSAANVAVEGTAVVSEPVTGEEFTYEVDKTKLGYYIAVIQSGTGSYIYNPILLAASLDGSDVMAGVPKDPATTDEYTWGKSLAKRTETSFDKHILHWGDVDAYDVDGTTTVVDEDRPNEQGVKTVSVGDVVEYSIEITVPKYSAAAKNKTLFVSDRMSAGLTFDETLFNAMTMKADGEDVDLSSVATVTHVDNGFNVNFDYDKVADFDKIEIFYSAVVNDQAIIGSEGNPNHADYWWARNPQEGTTFEPENPEDTPDKAEGLGHKEDEEIVFTYEVAIYKMDSETQEPLEGAVFEVYDADGKLVDVLTTNAQGLATTTKVEAGTYTFKEVKAPEGYTLSNPAPEFPVTANWTTATKTKISNTTEQHYTTEDNGTGQVGWIWNSKFYNEKPDDAAQPAYATGASKTEITKTVETLENEQGAAGTGAVFGDACKIPNSKTPVLPSTGGMGTYIFTIAGVAILAVAASLLVFKRRKEQ